MSVLRAIGLSKVYGSKNNEVKVIDNFSMEIQKGEFVGVMGPSGSGKTTLLHMLSTIDSPTSGHIEINGVNPARLNNKELSRFRRTEMGFIFQDFNLLDTLTLKENMILPLVLENCKLHDMEERVEKIARALTIHEILHKRTYEVSGGQQQRTAAARAVIHNPAIVFADEPTGNLDSTSSSSLMHILQDLNNKQNATILMVTHDPFAASFCNRIIFIQDGEHAFDMVRKGDRQSFFQEILHTLGRLGGSQDEASAHSAY